MKKTLNINLAGYPFIIDEDAYNLLNDYLDTIRYAFENNDDSGEIASDIESRVAELLIDNEAGGVRIVTLEEVTKVIERIGKPSEFIETSENIEIKEGRAEREDVRIEEETVSPPPYNSSKFSRNPFVRKKIFRDPENALLGGVCSGIAHYLHVDVTIVRLITVVLFFLSASTVAIAYVILWIVIPEASTPWQRMVMMGEDPTVENIGKTVTDNYEKNDNQDKQPLKGLERFLHSAFAVFVKSLAILGIIIAVPVLLALSIGLLGCCIAVFVIGVAMMGGLANSNYGMFDSTVEGLMVLYILLAVIGGIITLGIPLWLFVRMYLKKKDTPSSSSNRRALLVVWLCGIALLAVFTVKAVKKAHEIDNFTVVCDNKQDFKVEEIEEIRIHKDSVFIETSKGKKFTATGGTIDFNPETVIEESINTNEVSPSVNAMEKDLDDTIDLLRQRVTEIETEMFYN